MSDRINDAFDDKLIEMVERDRPTDSRGEPIPTWPSYPTPEPQFSDDAVYPIRPFSEDLIRAGSYDGADVWDGARTSFFRDLVAIAQKNELATGFIRAQVEGRDWNPPIENLIPSRAEQQTGGVDGAIARSSEASMSVERRLRQVRARLGEDRRPLTLGELRASNITSGSGGVGLMPQNGSPLYIAELFADAARGKSRLAQKLFAGQLPPTGNVVLCPRSTTGSAVVVQAAENTALTDAASVFDTTSSPVITVAGQQNVSRQLLDRGVNVDADIAASLGASFGAVLEAQTINGAGTSGELTGLLNATGITSDSYTDASPTASKAYGQIEKLLADVATAYGSGTDTLTLAMHPRRAAWIRDNAVLMQATNYGAAGVVETTGGPVNLGAGTNQDAVLALALQESPIFISPIQFAVAPGVLSNTLQVKLYAWAYIALLSARLPASVGKLTGTGLVAPTFV